MNKTNINKFKTYLIYLAISILFLLFFSYSTSPLTNYYLGQDSALFMLMGRGMNKGLLPYRDLYDIKGPYFYFLQQIANFIYDGKIGIFIIQIINTFISITLIDKIISIDSKNTIKKKIISILSVLWFLALTYSGGNLTEEFSLPMLLFCLLRYLEYIENINNKSNHNPKYAFIYGIFFSFFVFSKITNSAFMCAVILSIVISLVLRKEYKNLLANMICFIVGFVLTTLPIILFYYFNGALTEMINAVFINSMQYATKRDLSYRISSYFSIAKLPMIIPIFFPLIISFNKKIDKDNIIFSIITSIALFLATYLGNNYIHYFILVVPIIVYSFYLIYKYDLFENINKTKRAIIISLVSLLIVYQGYYIAINSGKIILRIADYSISLNQKHHYESIANEEKEIVSHIPDEDKNDIWGYGLSSAFYFHTETFPKIRHFDYIDQSLKYEYIKEDIKNGLTYNQPKWIIIHLSNENPSIPDVIKTVIENNYSLFESKNNYDLYLLK